MKITLAERDTFLYRIESQIKAKHELLLNKRKALEKTHKQNEFLKGIRDDYQTYYDYIVKQKQDQLLFMERLNQHVDEMVKKSEFTDKDLQRERREQNSILQEMAKIKEDLDKIIQQ
jgi:hypothetical protein